MIAWKAAPMIIVIALMLLPLSGASSFDLARYSVAICYIMAVIGLNIAFGYAGQLVLGHSVIMAAAAYVVAMLSVHAGWGATLAAPLAVLLGTLAGLVMMLAGLRVRGWYLALITLFAVLVLPKLVHYFEEWTGGEFGITGIKAFDPFGIAFDGVALYETVIVCLVLVWIGTGNFVNSSWGLRMRALRDAERAADAVGIDLSRTKLVVYIVSSVPAAVAGMLLAYTEQFVNGDSFGIGLALMLLTGMVLGGLGKKWGPIFGMVPLVAFSFWVGPFSQYNPLIFGIGLMVFAVMFTDGFAPVFTALARRIGLVAPADGAEAHFTDDAGQSPGTAESAGALFTPAPAGNADGDAMAVQAEGISKAFGGVQALDNIDFRLKRGQLCGIVGPNGSGKSTFLNAISGFIAPDAGRIRIEGRELDGLRPFEIARLGIGRTFQVPMLVEELSVRENVEIGLVGPEKCSAWGAVLRLPSLTAKARDRHRRAMQAIAVAGLPREIAESPVSDLPLGLKRVVEIARAIVSGPSLLLLDEPAAGLSDAERMELGRLLVRLKRTGMTVVVIEHNMQFVMTFCDEIAVLQNGRVTCHVEIGDELPDALLEYLNFGVEPRPASYWIGLRHVAG